MIKKYKEFIKESKEDIDSICNKYHIENYTINEDRSIDVDGDVHLHNSKLNELPLYFRNVSGYFDCSSNNLTSLKGCPKNIVGSFYCYNNKLTSLEDCPNEVGGDLNCSNNYLTTLKGCPEEVDWFSCNSNLLTSLDGCPNKVSGDFDCSYNKLTNFKKFPKSINGSFFNCIHNNIRDFYGFPDFWEGDVWLDYNPIFEIYDIFNKNNRCTELLNTTRTIVNGDSIRVEGILDVAEALNIELPEDWKEKIKSYKLIQW